MKRLWAPWRMKYVEYVTIEKKRSCFLCEAARSQVSKESLVIFKDENWFVMLNLYPYNTGHLLVAPYRHVATLDDLTEEELRDLGQVLQKAVKLVKLTYNPDGFNIGLNLGRVAGAGLEDHLHFHIVPRWNGDTNFMPILANTKVIPEAIYDTYERLAKKLKELNLT